MRTPDRFFALRTRRDHARVNRELARLFRDHGARRAMIRLHEGPVESLYLEPLDIWLAAHKLPNRYRNASVRVTRSVAMPCGRASSSTWRSRQEVRGRELFVRDASDQIWLAHTGMLGGRQTGISRSGFLQVLGGARQVTIDDVPEELVVLGTYTEPTLLLEQIARITYAASQYRDALAAGLRYLRAPTFSVPSIESSSVLPVSAPTIILARTIALLCLVSQ